MATNKGLFLCILLSVLLFPCILSAQDSYFFELDEEGNPHFTQVLEWEANPYVSMYELEIQDELGATVHSCMTEEPRAEINLDPGTYRYRITLYNLLNRPELTSPWYPIYVKKAEQPKILGMQPDILYMEDENLSFVLQTEGLVPESEFFLLDPLLGLVRYRLYPESPASLSRDDGSVPLFLRDERVETGDFIVQMINPGGLNVLSSLPLRIRYARPFEFFFSLAYAPIVPMYDEWFVQYWAAPFYPLGADCRFSFIFSKQKSGFYGAEAVFSIQRMYGGDEDSEIITDIFTAGIGFVYKYRFYQNFSFIGRLVPALSLSYFKFMYGDISGNETASSNISMSADVGIQYHLDKSAAVELSAGLMNIFYSESFFGMFRPRLAAVFYF